MPADSYSVVCDLGLENFDDLRAGRAVAKDAFAEVRRLGRLDDRVRATKMRRDDPLVVEIAITVEAATSWEAFDLGRAIVRSAVHAIGGSTAGWETLRPQVRRSPPRRRGRRRRQLPAPPVERRPDWATVSAAARRRGAVPAWLPPLEPADDVLIDLR